MEKGRLVVVGFATLATFTVAVAVLSWSMPDWRPYLVLAFPAVVATVNRLAMYAIKEVDPDELSDAELIMVVVAYPAAIFTSWITPAVYINGGGIYYFLITVLTLYITYLTLLDESCL
jgi:hypothetical protein